MNSFNKNNFDIVIEAKKASLLYWLDIVRFRELFFFLAWKDILIRYKQAVLGVAWSLLRPILTMIIFTFIFGKLARLSDGNKAYPILVFAGMLPWQFFANVILESTTALITNANMISKIYFPRLMIPLSTVVANVIDFLISLALMFALFLIYHHAPSWRLLLLPVFFIHIVLFSVGVGLWISALTVKYRDFRYVIPFVLQCGIYVSPVGFSSAVVPQTWRLLYSLNPMVGIIEGFRWSILGNQVFFDGTSYWLSCLLTLLFLLTGFKYFRNTERVLADII